MEHTKCATSLQMKHQKEVSKTSKWTVNNIFQLIADVGAPIAGALVMGAFIFIIMKQIMGGVVSQIGTLKGFCDMLVTRIKTMNNDMIRLDTSVSAALDLYPDLDRIARAENFVEDGSIDVRRD
jgi:hypothetical protein